MAAGDIIAIRKNLLRWREGRWADTDTLKVALITAASTPSATDDPSVLTTYTEVTPGGNYTAGGESLGTLAALLTESGGRITMDAADVSWAQDASNPTNARTAVIFNDDDADAVLFSIDLGSARDLSAADLNLNFHADGFYYDE